MINIEIDEPLNRSWIVTLVAEGYSTYDIVKSYNLTEEVILQNIDLLDKDVIIQAFNLSEDFVKKSLDLGYFEPGDITNFSMSSYVTLSEEFIREYSEFINWNKIILYASTQSDSFEKYISIIEKNDLWSLISANDLSIDFIRTWKDKLDWKYLSMVKCFTDDERVEFLDYIIESDNKSEPEEFLESSQFEFVKNMSNEELENLIEEINKQLYR